ncbi:MAG: SPOR domain-containing protein [Bryobacterales bacterium]|nr:SPOR domain-containing protein [Acidobacteriota bacterium]MCB9385824.1 SPOR domain-containing protein [Bryobacterales bacterium]
MAGPPLAASLAFIATLGALMIGYWAGYAVGTGGSEPIRVAQAAEKSSQPALALPQEKPAPQPAAAPVQPAPQAAQKPRVAGGLHLQVSALSSQQAAAQLQRELERQGYPVRVDQTAQDQLVRVYVGPVPKDELRAWTTELRKEGLAPFPKRL